MSIVTTGNVRAALADAGLNPDPILYDPEDEYDPDDDCDTDDDF